MKVRFQNVEDLPPKELRKLVDKGKKELGEGIVIVFASKDDKVGIAVGVTEKLTKKFDAVKFVKSWFRSNWWQRWWWKKRFCSSWWSRSIQN